MAKKMKKKENKEVSSPSKGKTSKMPRMPIESMMGVGKKNTLKKPGFLTKGK